MHTTENVATSFKITGLIRIWLRRRQRTRIATPWVGLCRCLMYLWFPSWTVSCNDHSLSICKGDLDKEVRFAANSQWGHPGGVAENSFPWRTTGITRLPPRRWSILPLTQHGSQSGSCTFLSHQHKKSKRNVFCNPFWEFIRPEKLLQQHENLPSWGSVSQEPRRRWPVRIMNTSKSPETLPMSEGQRSHRRVIDHPQYQKSSVMSDPTTITRNNSPLFSTP